MTGDEFDIDVGSHRLHAQRFGSPSAPLAVAVHGVSLNMRCFDVIGEQLGGDALQVVAFDLRGRGRSETTPSGSYGWESHARDVFGLADALGVDRFSVIGTSMGGSVAMKAAELDAPRLDAVVLVDVAGRVDRGVGELIGSLVRGLGDEYDSVEQYLGAVRAQGLADPWTEHWDRCYRYGAVEADRTVRARVSLEAIAEDRAYGATQDVYARWAHLTMPTLLLRATRELRRGVGHVVPAADREAFLREVAHATVVDIDANHLTINAHDETVRALRAFFGSGSPSGS